MRLATIDTDGRFRAALVRADRLLPIELQAGTRTSMHAILDGRIGLADVSRWADGQPESAWLPIDEVVLGPAVPDPGAIYTIGMNYRGDPEDADPAPERPMVYGKAASSVAAHGATLAWDRTLTDNVDAECELGVVIGSEAFDVSVADAMTHVFGYTIIDDISSRDPWLDGDQWLIGKSIPGFCPVGPWIVAVSDLDPTNLRLGCTINGEAIQDGCTDQMRFSIAEAVAYLSRHVRLRPGDLIATGTPARLASMPGRDRRLQRGDVATCWIQGIGELTTIIG
jgi:2-keto-4-pentenoate hydratase/2-oxohepta-3-ene-1,7-dioic acid hydratase in catechol pathway